MHLIGSSSISKGSSLRLLKAQVSGWVRSKSDAYSRAASLLRPQGILFSTSEMTSRAVQHALRSVRFNRGVMNGRRWRFLDAVAYYSGRRCPQGRFLKRNRYLSCGEPTQAQGAYVGEFYTSNASVEGDIEFTVEVTCQGKSHKNIAVLATQLQEDAMIATKELLFWHQESHQRFLNKETVELTVMLTDDHHIQQLNSQYLNEDHPTDVLSFPMDGVEDDPLPVMLLGDIVISLQSAETQAKQMQHSLRTECRILLIHALLHLFGYDHDRSDGEWQHMAEIEQQTLMKLGWTGSGLIAASEQTNTAGSPLQPSMPSETATRVNHDTPDAGLADRSITEDQPNTGDGTEVRRAAMVHLDVTSKMKSAENVALVALDLDGTLLTSQQQISEKTRDAVKEAIDRGFRIVLATGKARQGAIRACRSFGLYGDRGVISERSGGVFLQGLDVYTVDGRPIRGPDLPKEIVRSAFEYAMKTGTSIVGFTGDHCITLERTPRVVDLHERYYEPLAEVMPSVDAIVHSQPVKKIILMADALTVKNDLEPYWDQQLIGTSSQTVLPVSTMLELIPRGINKWDGLQSLLKSMSLSANACMAVGDGINDYEMIKNVAVGIAMGNAVDEVKHIADHVVSSNDEDGIAEAFESFLFS